jgi:2-oxoglutarate ferredoxin oxidoreductase subunit gamma
VKKKKYDIRITGFGGQGVILSAHILGKAASIFGKYNATMTQSFGPEARGSACSAQLVIDEDRVLYPYIRRPDVLVAMSQEGYEKYKTEMSSDGILVYEEELVHPAKAKGKGKGKVKAYGIPAARLAEDVVGRKITMNIIMIGFFTAVTGLIAKEAMKEAVLSSVPAGTEKLNTLAFETGYEHYEKTYKK